MWYAVVKYRQRLQRGCHITPEELAEAVRPAAEERAKARARAAELAAARAAAQPQAASHCAPPLSLCSFLPFPGQQLLFPVHLLYGNCYWNCVCRLCMHASFFKHMWLARAGESVCVCVSARVCASVSPCVHARVRARQRAAHVHVNPAVFSNPFRPLFLTRVALACHALPYVVVRLQVLEHPDARYAATS